MNKRYNIFITLLVAVCGVFCLCMMLSGTALKLNALGESFMISVKDGKDVSDTVERLGEYLGEDLSSVTELFNMLKIGYYLLLVSVVIAGIGLIASLLSGFKHFSGIGIAAFIVSAIAGILYVTFQSGLESSVNQALGIFGSFVEVGGDGSKILWVNGVLLIISAFLTILKTKTKGE